MLMFRLINSHIFYISIKKETMSQDRINFQEKLTYIKEYWTPKVISEMNDYQFKLVKVKGNFIWHCHQDTDETFIVLEGTLHIELRDRVIVLKKGELFVVPKGTEHKPYANEECHILLVEPKHVINTGEKVTEQTAPNDEWI